MAAKCKKVSSGDFRSSEREKPVRAAMIAILKGLPGTGYLAIVYCAALTAFFPSVAAAAAPASVARYQWVQSPSFYMESVYDDRTRNLVSQGRASVDLVRYRDRLSLYAGIALSQDALSDTRTIYNDNSFAPFGGLRFDIPFLSAALFSEYRQTMRVWRRPEARASSEADLRAGAFFYRWFDLAGVSSGKGAMPWLKLFSENYGEAIYTSMNDDNILAQLRSKLGPRLKLTQRLMLDGFVELHGKADRIGLPYENDLLVGPGARVALYLNRLSLAMSGSRVFGKPTGPEWNAMLTFGGSF